MVSIIIPAYNQNKFLAETLNSILEQTYANWECLVIDDGSTDDTSTICNEYVRKDKRFRYFYKQNGGLSSARNFGLKKANGEFIQFLDSDDIIKCNKLEKSLDIFNKNEEINLVISDFNVLDNSTGKYYEPYFQLEQKYFDYISVVLSWDIKFSIPIHCPLFRSDLISGIRFNEEIQAKEDWLFWIKIFKIKSVRSFYINEKLAIYRIHPDNMTSQLTFLEEQNINALIYILRDLEIELAKEFLAIRIKKLTSKIKKLEDENGQLSQLALDNHIKFKQNTYLNSIRFAYHTFISRLKKNFKIPALVLNQNKDKSSIKYLKNVFNTDFDKSVLVSYITHPFLYPDHYFYHSNREECKIICEIFNRLEYNVDLVDFDYNDIKFTQAYDILFGYGAPLEEYIKVNPRKDYNIYLYRNGTDDSFSDEKTIKRLHSIYSESGFILAESASIFHLNLKLQLAFADKIIVLGNNYIKKTFEKYTDANIFSLDLMYYDIGPIDINNKSITNSRNNFLWFGSRGAIRKGLDLCLKYFSKRGDLNLYIAGFNEEESHFKELYEEKLNSINIYNIGFVRMDSDEFTLLMNKCGAVIFPTIWEGGGGAVLNVIAAGGLIPIVPESIGLDFNDLEIKLQNLTTDDIHDAVSQYLSISDKNLFYRSKQLQEYIRAKHTKEKFEKKLYRYITI